MNPTYAAKWLPNRNEFGYPFRRYIQQLPQSPDVAFNADSLSQAARFIKRLNEEMVGRRREDEDVEAILAALRKEGKFFGVNVRAWFCPSYR